MPRRADPETKRNCDRLLLQKRAEKRDLSDRRSNVVLAEEDARRAATAAKTTRLRALREAEASRTKKPD
jgi:hypothetical protein